MPISSVCTMPCMPTRKIAVCVSDRMPAIDSDCSSTSDVRAMPDWCMSRSTYSHPTPSSTCAARTEGSAHARGRQRGADRRRREWRASAAHVERGERGQHGNGSRHKNSWYSASVMLAHDPFLGQLGSFRCRGLGMSHRIGQGITGFHRVSSVFGGRTAETAFFGKSIAFFGKIMAIFGNIFVILKSFLAI